MELVVQENVRCAALGLVSESLKARLGSPRANEERMVLLVEAPVRANETADLSLQERIVEAVEVRTS